jgi:hypothetical protein
MLVLFLAYLLGNLACLHAILLRINRRGDIGEIPIGVKPNAAHKDN